MLKTAKVFQEYINGLMAGLRHRIEMEKFQSIRKHPQQSNALIIMSDKIADQVLKDNALKLDDNKNKSSRGRRWGRKRNYKNA